jgi:hypothetical protein
MAAETYTILRGPSVLNTGTQDTVSQVKTIVLASDATVDATDTLSIDIAPYGGSLVWGVLGFKHTTDNSVIVTENPVSAVVGTTLTLTIAAGTDNDPRQYVIFYQ